MTSSQVLRPVTDNADWTGADLSSGEGWRYFLEASEIDDLKKMAARVRPLLGDDPNRLMLLSKDQVDQVDQVDQLDQFDLGAFAPRLQQIYAGIKQGLGLALIKGLPIDELALIDVATIYWGIGLHLGQATPNNPDGDMLGHITDLGKTQKDANTRGYQTRESMDYHCDQSDIVGLMCIRTAKSGGVSKVASSVAVFNELLETHPEYAQALAQPLYWSKLGEYAEGDKPYYQSPVFNFLDGKLCVSFGPTHIEKGHDLPGIPPLNRLQRDAIHMAEQIADQNRFDMELEPGDMQFLNNYVALHTRSAYVDHDDPEMKRLLWRLWLVNADLRPRTNYTKQFQNGVRLGSQRQQIRL